MKIKKTITDKDIDFFYDVTIVTTIIMAAEVLIWRIFVC